MFRMGAAPPVQVALDEAFAFVSAVSRSPLRYLLPSGAHPEVGRGAMYSSNHLAQMSGSN